MSGFLRVSSTLDVQYLDRKSVFRDKDIYTLQIKQVHCFYAVWMHFPNSDNMAINTWINIAELKQPVINTWISSKTRILNKS
jgi:hypothetical protein